MESNEPTSPRTATAEGLLADDEVVQRVLAGEVGLFEILMRRYNQRVYRVARSIVHDESEAEDIMQDAYVRAYRALHQFQGRAAFSTWLTRIAVYEALSRRRQRLRLVSFDPGDPLPLPNATGEFSPPPRTPEDVARNRELGAILEAAVDSLPETHRIVFVLREIEGLSAADAGRCLGISPENVRVRLHRARSLLRREIEQRLGDGAERVFEFHLSRCDRVVGAVLARLEAS